MNASSGLCASATFDAAPLNCFAQLFNLAGQLDK